MPGIHGKDKDKEMEHYPGHKDDDKDMRMLRPEVQEEKLTEEEVEKFAMEDLYTSAEKAEEKAKAMGISGSHMHIHKIDDREIKMYMPGESHEQYMEAKKKMMEKEEEMMDDEEKMAITPKDVHTKRPIGTYEQDDCDCEESKAICDCKEEQKNNAVEQTFNLNGVEIFSTGIWNGDRYSEKDLDAMIENFDDVGFEPPVKLGHNEEQSELRDGQPALGYISKIYKVGSKLVADFKELPKKVYDAIKRGNYKRVSSEIYWNYKANGSTFNRVLKAVALLGADIPAVTNLESIEGLYSNMGTGEVKYHYNGKESEIMEEKHDTISIDEHNEKLAQLQQEKEEVMKEYQAHKDEIKKSKIASYMEELKAEGKILPVQSKEVEALLTTATDEKVYSYSQDEKEVSLSQFELLTKVLDANPKLVEFAEVSEEGETVLAESYDNAGLEVDRRAKLYLDQKKAENYGEAIKAVLAADEELAEKYESERR
jgi:acylphosphatase